MNKSEQTRIPYSTFDVSNGDKVVTMSLENVQWLVSLAITALSKDGLGLGARKNHENLEILQKELGEVEYN